MPVDYQMTAPDPDREARRYVDYFHRRGLTKATVLESVDLTYQRSELFFGEAHKWLDDTGAFKAACSMGCAYCCHTLVSMLPPEIFYLADHIEKSFSGAELAAVKERVIAHDKAHRGKSGGARLIEKLACPLLDLETNLCSVHEARPLTCRAMHSGDVKPCQAAFETQDPYLPAPSHPIFFKNTQAYYDAFGTALDRMNVVIHPVELSAGLSTVWTQKNVLVRWMKGEDVFAGCGTAEMSTDAAPSLQ